MGAIHLDSSDMRRNVFATGAHNQNENQKTTKLHHSRVPDERHSGNRVDLAYLEWNHADQNFVTPITMRSRQPIATGILFCTALASQTMLPERKVDGHLITSARDPQIQIRLPNSVQYLGADRWILYDIADCELHAFVEADKQKKVQRLYWIQFESYVPARPELKHKYDSPRHIQLGGLDFYVDTWASPKDSKTEPGSDVEHIRALLHRKGYVMPAGTMSVRLVHLLDQTKRKELMIIYTEDLAPTGLTPAALRESGNAHDRWPALESGLIARAKNKIEIPLHPY